MKHTFNHCCTFMILAVYLTSCVPMGPFTPVYYVPEERQKENIYYQPAPFEALTLSNKNDLHVSVAGGDNSKSAQLGYMPFKHFAVNGAYTSFPKGNSTGNITALAAGYIYNPGQFVQFETYAGYGFGKIENNHSSGWSTNKIRQWYIQPALGLINNPDRTVQLGLSTRISFMHFNIDTAFATDREPFSTSQVMTLYNHPDQVFLEPSVTFRFGWKNFMFNSGYNWSTNISGNDFNRKKSNYTLGLIFKVNTGSAGKKK